MLLFQENTCISICLKNKNSYVRLATEDLQKDFLRVSYLSDLPAIVKQEQAFCLIIEDNPCKDSPICDESFSITCNGSQIRISAPTYLGTLWGIYTFSEKILGVHPCYLFNDLEIEKKHSLEVGEFSLQDAPQKKGFRGIFINDEDLLTAWKEGGGLRHMSYPWYGVTVAGRVMDKVVETALRLKLNLVIPASFLDIDNPPEKALADCVARRGIFLSQHHIEPLGLNTFTFENYCKKFGGNPEFSYINNPEKLMEGWRYYAQKWAEYENVVWQLGLRGKTDRPVWEESTPTETELVKYADFINDAIQKQTEIVVNATKGKAKYFSSTLWMEGSTLMEKGLLRFGKNTVLVFSDNGPNQMFGKDYARVPREKDLQYGIYYHAQYHDAGPHLAPQTGLDKLYYNLKKAKDMGDDSYFILNVSNVREFDFEINAYAEMIWNMENFSIEKYLDGYCATYGNQAEQARKIVNGYFHNLPCLETEYLRYVHAKYFNYDYEEQSPGIKNFILKDELVLVKGSEMIFHFRNEFPTELYEKMYEELKKSVPVYESLIRDIESFIPQLCKNLGRHVQCKWWLYSQTLLHFYRWFVYTYEGKRAYDKNDVSQMQEKLNLACESLEEYLSLRKCAEYGEFKNWYRGDLKMNVFQRLLDTRKLLGQTFVL